MKNEILKLFSSKEIKEKLACIHDKLVSYEIRIIENAEAADSGEVIEEADYNDDGPSSPEEYYDELVIGILGNLTKPLRVTKDDIIQLLSEYLGDNDFETTYNRILEGLIKLISIQTESPPIIFCHSVGLFEKTSDFKTLVWQKKGLELDITGSAEDKNICTILSGKMSNKALLQFMNEVIPVIQCAVRSIVLLSAKKENNNNQSIIHHLCYNTTFSDFSNLPLVGTQMLLEKQYILREYLNAFFTKTSTERKKGKLKEKNVFDNRIKNAVHLLIVSDQQTNDAVGLSLSISALEALLCEDASNIAEQLASRITVLLEPELDHRLKAEKIIKTIYDARSRLLHGDTIESKRTERIKARNLAASVLDAVMGIYKFGPRIDDELKPILPGKLFQDLKKRKYQSGRPDGIVDYEDIRKYWRS